MSKIVLMQSYFLEDGLFLRSFFFRGKWVCRLVIVGVMAGFFVLSSKAHAFEVDRSGAIGVSQMAPFQVRQLKEASLVSYDASHSFDFLYFFSNQWAGGLWLNFFMTGNRPIEIGIGPQFFLSTRTQFSPYWFSKFVYLADPRNGLGCASGIGGLWNVSRFSDLDNLGLYVETAMKMLFLNNGNDAWIYEPIRIGISWGF